MKTALKRTLIALPVLALLLAAFHVEENWRGRHVWRQRRAALAAEGVSLDPASYAPPPVPDEENFAAVPFVADAVSGKAVLVSGTLADPFMIWPTAGDWRMGRTADYEAFARELGNRSMDEYLKPFEGRLAEMAQALMRPGCRLKLDYQHPDELPALLSTRKYVRVIRVRALMRLHTGHPEQALEDVLTGLRFVQHLRQEPHLITQLLRLASVSLILQPVWEGLKAHAWNEAQLLRLGEALAPVDLIGPIKVAWRFERIFSAMRRDMERERITWNIFEEGKPEDRVRLLLRDTFIPSGWIFLGVVARDRVLAETLEGAMDPRSHRVHPEGAKQAEEILRFLPRPIRNFADMTAGHSQSMRLAQLQTGLDQARVAGALERFRLAKGVYPESLAALAPGFMASLPQDVVTGEPLHYARTEKGYRLYSVGWDGKDEGGRVELDPAKGFALLERGDWVWSDGK